MLRFGGFIIIYMYIDMGYCVIDRTKCPSIKDFIYLIHTCIIFLYPKHTLDLLRNYSGLPNKRTGPNKCT